jgi:hypothetical protein
MLLSGDIRGFFREAMTDAMRHTGVRLTDHAQVYVVHLMAEFSRAERAFAGADPGERPALAIMMSRAADAEPDEALRIYKHLGDSSLVLSGYFPESIEKELVSRDYYAAMGENAYSSVAALCRPQAALSSVLFEELAERFRDLVELLEAMSISATKDAPLSDKKILELVERYQKTGNREILEALKGHGVVLRPGLGSDDDEVH